MSYRLPTINAPDLRGQMTQMHSYLRQLVEEMNVNLEAEAEAAETEKAAQGKARENQEAQYAVIRCYPVGSLYLSMDSTSPQKLFGGKWEQLKDRFLLAAGDTYLPGSVGGEAQVQLTLDQIPAHSHRLSCREITVDEGTELPVTVLDGADSAVTTAAGGGLAHNNLPPYLAVYVWKRIG